MVEITDVEKNIASHDCRVGVSISGGLDSTVVLHHVCEKNDDVWTFSMEWGDSKEEADYATKIAEAYGTKHTNIRFTREFYQEALEECMKVFDRPRWNVWPWMIAREAYMSGCKILYIGEGCDDILGYSDRSYIRGWISQLEYILPVWKQVCAMWNINLATPFLDLEESIKINRGLPTTLPICVNDSKSLLWEAYGHKIKAPVLYPKKPALQYYDILGQSKHNLLVKATKLWLRNKA